MAPSSPHECPACGAGYPDGAPARCTHCGSGSVQPVPKRMNYVDGEQLEHAQAIAAAAMEREGDRRYQQVPAAPGVGGEEKQ